jgi:hypothetical protein
MAKQIANVDIQTETFNTWLLRTNDIISALSSEVLTANSTQGITGSINESKNARLYGTFTANTIATNSYTANSTHFVISPSAKLLLNNSNGGAGQVLTTDGSVVYWSSPPGSGTVTKIITGNGLAGGPIDTTGTITVKAGTGIKVDTSGVSVNTTYISTLTTNATTLLNKSWASPDEIGVTTPSTGTFTTITADQYKIRNVDTFLLNSTSFRFNGYIDALTPAGGRTGGVRIRATDSSTPHAYFQITNSVGNQEIAYADITNDGNWAWSNSASFDGDITTTGNINLNNGDIADLDDGYGSLRFTNGVKIYSPNKGGTAAITLKSDGTAYLGENKIISAADFENDTSMTRALASVGGYTSYGGYTKLPNGIIIQWGQLANANADTGASTFSFPIAFPSACLSIVGSVSKDQATYSKQNNPTFWIRSKSTFGASSYDSLPNQGIPHMFIAIGY